jgi:hypothetical protein
MAKDIILKLGTYMETVSNKDIAKGAIPGTSLEKFVTNLLKSPTCCAKYVTLTKGAVTQSGAITTAVTLNQPAGEITTVSATINAGAMSSFTLNNSYIKADSVIIATVNDTTGSGLLAVQVDGIVAGSCTISLGGVVANTGVAIVAFAIF